MRVLAHNEEFGLTPLEAVLSIERVDMERLFLEHGSRMDATIWTRVICFAELVGASDVRVLLEQWRRQFASASCEGVSSRW